MDPHPGANGPVLCAGLQDLLDHALFLDLEVSPSGQILKLGAHFEGSTVARSTANSIRSGLVELSPLAERAICVVGHNVFRHDLPVLQGCMPNHPLLSLPVIDTLVLSPIAFPENPYHRLVKDYKLLSESVNDPVADARLSGRLLEDELRSLIGFRQKEPALFQVLHYLLVRAEAKEDQLARGMEMIFVMMGGMRPEQAQALDLCRGLFRRWGCASAPVDEALMKTSGQRLCLAYALTWMRVAGSNSVLPPWVRHEYPETVQLIKTLRETPCRAEDCAYCRNVYNPQEQLKQFFEFPAFRPLPANAAGGSLQFDIVEAGMADQSLLAILPTSGGKSLCYQLPALVRNYRRGVLTIVISPLQALMKDQVDGLVRRTGTPFAAALSGLLTPPERGDVLRRIKLGDVAILYVSPEQFRNRSFCEAIAQREIGCWVFDEVHCLSKWGHDFRSDYLYAGRFIREFSAEHKLDIAAIACFTATAKREVKEEILTYFKTETGRDLRLFEGGVERGNLSFEVQTVTAHGKLERVHELLADHLPAGSRGSAIVFRALRNSTEETGEYLKTKGWKAAHFHAGLAPPEKKRIQDEFLAGAVEVICATNAFGMGIDKEDVRLVIHADTPGSLENYLQEAGRAGRDGLTAHCVLLYDDEDCEQQFRLGAFSELSRRDIAQILRGLRKAARGGEEQFVITPGEILRDEDVETDIRLEDRDADTKVRTAVSWLERAGFLLRDQNVTNVFQARLLVRDLKEADAKMAACDLSALEKSLWQAILRELINAGQTEALSVDKLALLPEFTLYAEANQMARANPEFVSAKALRILGNMAQAGLLKRDTLLTAFVRHKVADHSRIRLDRLIKTDRKLVDVLALEQPDPEDWQTLSVRLLNQRLLDEGCQCSPELIRSLLRSLTQDGRGFADAHGSIELRHSSRESYRVKLRRSWATIAELADKRRRVASCALGVLLGKIPADAAPQADLLVAFTFEELQKAVEQDQSLHSNIKDINAAMERGLMYLHEHQVIILRQGLAVFRSAMTIRLRPEARGEKYKVSDYQPLEHHYHERVLQIHVMSEYARLGLEQIRSALELMLAYFTLDKEEFIRRYLKAKKDLLDYATTAQSFQRIVTDIRNPAQAKIVAAAPSQNMLILAGPGSGKTKTVVHRCAYLLRIQRVGPRSVLVCCFNRSAAIELRTRLKDLAGSDANGVTVLTYHSLAMRLLGRSSAGRADGDTKDLNFDALIPEAVKLLRGERQTPGMEADEVRERLLAGFQYILVDEYQDIDEPQYELISALAGRTLNDPDLKLSILAVGDDDQNIYAFRGANVEFIRRFQQDYGAEEHRLVENYRSTRYIIEAANDLISDNADRMKIGQPIQINQARELLPPGGEFGRRDKLSGGRVQIISVADGAGQAQAVLAEIRRLRELGVAEWSSMAVLSSTHADLAQIRALAERESVPVRWFASRSDMPPLHQIREIRAFLRQLQERRSDLARASQLLQSISPALDPSAANPWIRFLRRMVEAWQSESDDAELPVQDALEFLYEFCAESRRDFSYGQGVALCTVHSAKGTEYDHVLLIGPWQRHIAPKKREEQRRAFYVGMTRARKTLAILDRADLQPSLASDLNGTPFLRRQYVGDDTRIGGPALSYDLLSLDAFYLDYPGQWDQSHPIHRALAALKPGDKLRMERRQRTGLVLCDASRTVLARLSRKAEGEWSNRLGDIQEIRFLAAVGRSADQQVDIEHRQRLKATDWEIPVVEVVFKANDGAPRT